MCTNNGYTHWVPVLSLEAFPPIFNSIFQLHLFSVVFQTNSPSISVFRFQGVTAGASAVVIVTNHATPVRRAAASVNTHVTSTTPGMSTTTLTKAPKAPPITSPSSRWPTSTPQVSHPYSHTHVRTLSLTHTHTHTHTITIQ